MRLDEWEALPQEERNRLWQQVMTIEEKQAIIDQREAREAEQRAATYGEEYRERPLDKRYVDFENPDWGYWYQKYPESYARYLADESITIGEIPTPEDRPNPRPAEFYDWPYWYAVRATPNAKQYYSFLLWPDDGSGHQRMGMYPGQEYPERDRLGPIRETVTLPITVTEEQVQQTRELYGDNVEIRIGHETVKHAGAEELLVDLPGVSPMIGLLALGAGIAVYLALKKGGG